VTQSLSDSISPNIPWWLVLLEGIFAVIVGISLLVAPRMTIAVVVQILGLYWLIVGILAIINIFVDRDGWGLKLAAGILGIVAGIVVIRHPLWSTIIIPSLVVILIAIGGILIGIIDMIRGIRGAGLGTGILGIVSLLLGVILLFNPVEAAFASTLALGIVALAGGMIAIVMAFRLR
jgi:uncharacterized membrane protein HdeD (DUF308 family)